MTNTRGRTLLFLFQSSAAVQPSLLPSACSQLPSLSLSPAPSSSQVRLRAGQHRRLGSHVAVCLLVLAYYSAVLLQMELPPFPLQMFLLSSLASFFLSPFEHPHKPPLVSNCSHPFLNMPKLRWQFPP